MGGCSMLQSLANPSNPPETLQTAQPTGPDNTQRSSFDQLWSSDLRPDNATDDRLPEAWHRIPESFSCQRLDWLDELPRYSNFSVPTRKNALQDMVVTKIAEISPTAGRPNRAPWSLAGTTQKLLYPGCCILVSQPKLLKTKSWHAFAQRNG